MILAVGVVVVGVQAPAANAQQTASSAVLLHEGIGMGERPSVRVRRVQRVLDERGYSLGRPGVDGRFGPLTAAAVRRFQSDYGLTVDGIVGPKTRRIIRLVDERATGGGQRSQGGDERRTGRDRDRGATAPRSGSGPGTTPGESAAPSTGTTPGASTAPSTGSAQASGTSTGDRQADRTPGPRSALSDGEDTGATVLRTIAILLAVLLLTAALAWALRRRRRHGGRSIVPIQREVFLEGRSADDRIGSFRGYGIATALPANGDDPNEEALFLVDDPRKAAPVWVRQAEIQRSPSALTSGDTVVGYVSLGEGDENVAFGRIEEACEERGWQLSEIVRDEEPARGLDRPGLQYALQQVAGGNARGVVVSDVRHLSRSLVDLGVLLEWFRDAQASLIALDLDLDTTTPVGVDTAATLITLSGFERDRVTERRRRGIARVDTAGKPRGRPAVSDRPELLERIAGMRQAGMTLQAIADQLNEEGVPTIRGGQLWRPSSVQAALGYRRPRRRREEGDHHM
jgi:DNA invertase Pin-like site-specific DNA recombinase